MDGDVLLKAQDVVERTVLATDLAVDEDGVFTVLGGAFVCSFQSLVVESLGLQVHVSIIVILLILLLAKMQNDEQLLHDFWRHFDVQVQPAQVGMFDLMISNLQ